MRKPKDKIKLDKKYVIVSQYGGEEDNIDYDYNNIIYKEWDKYAFSIGRLIIYFSELEESVNNDFATLINERAHDPGLRIVKYLEFREKVDILRDDHFAFINTCIRGNKKQTLLEEAEIIYKKLCELSEFRNKVSHANWMSLDKSGFVTCKIKEDRIVGGLRYEKIKMTPGVIIKFIRQISSLSNRLDEFRQKIWDEMRKENIRNQKTNNIKD